MSSHWLADPSHADEPGFTLPPVAVGSRLGFRLDVHQLDRWVGVFAGNPA